MNDLTKQDWDVLDDAHQRMESRMIDWCVKVSEMDGSQEEIGDRYNISRVDISKMVIVGNSADKFARVASNLPTGFHALSEMANMDVESIKQLCSLGVPTRAMVRGRKVELQLIDPPASKKLENDHAEGNVLVNWANLVPASELDGLSDLGIKMLEKQESKLVPLLVDLNQNMKKDVLKALVGIVKYQQTILNRMVASQVKVKLKERIEELDTRERRLAQREKAVQRGINIKEKKLIQGILHPDNAPDGKHDKYAKAFDAFRKVA